VWKGAKVVADRHWPSSAALPYVSTEQDGFEERVLRMTVPVTERI
jgi:hypothetical protein